MEAHLLKTLDRIEPYQTMLKIQDTSEIDFTTHRKMDDVGYLSGRNCTGLKLHSTLAVSTDGMPLGIINQKIWSRDNSEKGKRVDRHKKKIKEKESYRWLEAHNETEKLFVNTKVQVTIGDREADIYDLFIEPRVKNSHFLVRAAQDRLLEHVDRKLFTAIENSSSQGNLLVEIGKKDGQKSRVADLTIKYEKLKIKAPQNTPKEMKVVELNVILVEELSPCEGIDAIKWILLTTLEINTLEDAIKYVRWYSYRWLIERYFYVLKSGCGIEDLQLSSGEKIKRSLPIYSIIACNLLNITYRARIEPESSCAEVLTEKEWKTLYVLTNKKSDIPKEAPPIKDAVRWLGKLGGFLGRKCDGNPGVKTLWRGYRKLTEILEGVNLLNELFPFSLESYG